MTRIGRVTGLTVRGAAVLGLGVLLVVSGVLLRWWPVMGLGMALLAVVLADLIATRPDPGIVVERRVEPRTVYRGETSHGHLRISGGRGLPTRRSAREPVEQTLIEVPMPDSGGVHGAETAYEIPAPRRGVMQVGPVTVRRGGLAGCAAREREIGEVVQVRVLPRPLALHGLPRGTVRVASGADERVEHGGTDLVGLHVYVPGDDLRRLHWATSARSGDLMIRDDADPSEPHVLVVLDDRSASYPAGTEDFEEAVEVASAICDAAIQAGRRMQLQCLSGRIDVEVEAALAGRPPAAAREVLHTLAEVQLTESAEIGAIARRNLDVVAVVTGALVDRREVHQVTASAGEALALVVDGQASTPIMAERALVTLTAGTSRELAALWDRTVRS